MKKIITILLTLLILVLQPVSAQDSENNENFKYFKAREILEDNGDIKEARGLLIDNIEEYPKHIPSYLLLTGIHRNLEDYSSALSTIDQALKNNHKNSNITDNKLLWWKASVYQDMDETQKALDLMYQVVKKGKKTDKEDFGEMLESLAQLQYDMKQYDESDKTYYELRKMDESNQLPFIGLARNMIARGRYDEALSFLEKCKKYDSDYPEIYRFEVRAYEKKGEYKKMIDSMVKLYEKSDDSDYLDNDKFMKELKYSIALIKEKIASNADDATWELVLTSIYMDSYMFAEAIEIIDGLIDEYGNNPILLSERARCYENLGLGALALEDISEVLKSAKGDDVAYYHAERCRILKVDGRYEDAISDIGVYIDRYPTRAYGYYIRGAAKEVIGDFRGALEDYTEGICVDEDESYTYFRRGKLLHKLGRKQEAKADFEVVVKKDTVVEGGSSRQYALHFLGMNQEAEEWMEKLVEDNPNKPVRWYDKACLLALMGRGDEAITALEIALGKGYWKFAHMETDSDLDSIREREDFKALIQKYKSLQAETLKKLQSGKQEEETASLLTEVDMKKMYGGTYEVPCHINGLPLRMIFDTGASDVTISSVEANFMLKNDYLTEDDIRGKKNYMTASGEIHEGTVITLREVKVGEAVLKNIDASVVHHQKAPLLLGQSVLERFGTITIDNVNSKLLIKQ